MNKGGRYSVGESSLGYLFGSGEQPPPSEQPTASATGPPPPAIGTNDHRNSINPPNMPSQNAHLSNNYPRSRGQNLGNFITVSLPHWFISLESRSVINSPAGILFFIILVFSLFFFFLFQGRPTTKVKSPPGGDSSLGYLFGDKWSDQPDVCFRTSQSNVFCVYF